MGELRYLAGVNTLRFSPTLCVGCGICLEVCPHAVFEPAPADPDKKVRLREADACMECGACTHNCPVGAIQVEIGVGCVQALLKGAGDACC